MNKETKPLAPYIGGKVRLAKKIIAKIESIPHTTYAEPFVGMGGVFLRRQNPSKVEAINDINGDLINLFRIVKKHPDELIKSFDLCLSSRLEFYRLKSIPSETLTDIERAARFLYLQRSVYRGIIDSSTFNSSRHKSARINFLTIQDNIRPVAQRLASVTIEQLDFEKFIKLFDDEKTLFYLDPPYFGCENDYGKGIFNRSDFERLKTVLSNIKGRFILSLNDRSEIRELFKSFIIESVDITYSINPSQVQKTTELLITN